LPAAAATKKMYCFTSYSSVYCAYILPQKWGSDGNTAEGAVAATAVGIVFEKLVLILSFIFDLVFLFLLRVLRLTCSPKLKRA
jgi:hypothetical protein